MRFKQKLPIFVKKYLTLIRFAKRGKKFPRVMIKLFHKFIKFSFQPHLIFKRVTNHIPIFNEDDHFAKFEFNIDKSSSSFLAFMEYLHRLFV